MELFGYPLFGFWLPFIGWQDIEADADGAPCGPGPEACFMGSFFGFEWLGFGVMIVGGDYRPI